MPELTTALRNFTGQTIVNLLFLAAAGVLVHNNRTVGRTARRVFMGSLGALACIVFADWFTYLFGAGHPELRGLHAALMALTFAAAPIIPVAIANTIFPQDHVRWLHVLLVSHAALEYATVFLGLVFWIDDANVYHRGVLYPAYMLVYTLSALHLAVTSIRAGRVYQSTNMGSILAILLCMTSGVVLQVANADVRTTWPAVSMAVVLYFLFYVEMVLRTDALTKLLNRHSYEEFVENPPLPCVAVLIDLDDFKHANDTYGHAFGDVCLSTIAGLIRRAYGSAGLCYRTGGDEFTVVLTRQLDSADALTARLVQLVQSARQKDGRLPTVSVGLAQADVGCTSIEDVVREADARMYEAKRASKR